MEVGLNSVERVREYGLHLPQEAERVALPPSSGDGGVWPSRGALTVDNVSVRYRPELPLTLRGVSFALEGGTKLGLCGRTGSGKSTSTFPLLR